MRVKRAAPFSAARGSRLWVLGTRRAIIPAIFAEVRVQRANGAYRVPTPVNVSMCGFGMVIDVSRVTPLTVDDHADTSRPTIGCCDPRATFERRTMPHVLPVAALEFGHPVPFVVLGEAGDVTFHAVCLRSWVSSLRQELLLNLRLKTAQSAAFDGAGSAAGAGVAAG